MDELTFDDQIGWWTNVADRGKRMKHYYEYSVLSDDHRHSLCGRTHHIKNIVSPLEGDKVCHFCGRKVIS